MNSNSMASIGQGRCHAENDTSGILSLSGWRGDNNGLTIGAYKNGLPLCANQYYTAKAPAKSGVRIGLLVICAATYDAPCVFFYVVNLALPFFRVSGIIRGARKVMVGWVGASSEAPVSVQAGKTNLAQSTTSKIGLFGGGSFNYCTEAANMATTLATPQTKFIWLIAAVRRDCPTIKAVIHHIAAHSEREARRTLARDHVTFFAGRVPAQEVRHV
ncbi:host cell division inhibitor Icd-like protein [Enterobacter chengduensis]|uniref:host cell division inhibitor Icd-like protein n=1 Tax=Enterobacter chengduensis TaxID=2494701 RepID=UPI0022390EFA|nr:host cell division inhibitor Icd-like protein [Enterobacter chengduensis]MCW4822205.1 host cell division inhibitor Icd-like protein [Enterobacter chengduensis]MCW5064138.1 host cell division inhibitor Icd-like protein [Enterobacter chengduensis]MCW5068992.1 host cell division inhibitor Icd-like protein [Enterobacter chengduensis]MCW5081945.1 host cell division inhibitor Icd-like protein [Enterobacter chengduensis]